MPTLKTDLEKLNKEQREAVLHQDGPLLIVAGAGTGKTTVITQRILNLIDPLHKHEVPFTSETGYDRFSCDVCKTGHEGGRNHCAQCKFDCCSTCYSNYEKLVNLSTGTL